MGKKKTAELLRNFYRLSVGWQDGLDSLDHRVRQLPHFFIGLHGVVMRENGDSIRMQRETWKHLGFTQIQGSWHLASMENKQEC